MGEFPFPWRRKIHRCLKSRRIRGLNTWSEINKTRKRDKKERLGHRHHRRFISSTSQRPARISDFCHEQKFQKSAAADICLKHCFRACKSTSTGWALGSYPDGWRFPQGREFKASSQLPHQHLLLLNSRSFCLFRIHDAHYLTLSVFLPFRTWIFSSIHPSLQLSKEKLWLGRGERGVSTSWPDSVLNFNFRLQRHICFSVCFIQFSDGKVLLFISSTGPWNKLAIQKKKSPEKQWH